MERSAVLLRMKVHIDDVKIETMEDDSIDVIHLDKKGRDGWGTCSGVYIKDNVILSAAHCVEMSNNVHLKGIWVKIGKHSAKATVIKIDKAADLVLLHTSMKGTPVKLAWRAIRGEDCWVIGNPLGLPDVITKGIVSQVHFTWAGQKAFFIIVDATTLPGNSGGPVVDSSGHLIGILTRGTSFFGELGATGLGFAVDLGTIREFLK
jgi:S1-C subfamily serine protease